DAASLLVGDDLQMRWYGDREVAHDELGAVRSYQQCSHNESHELDGSEHSLSPFSLCSSVVAAEDLDRRPRGGVAHLHVAAAEQSELRMAQRGRGGDPCTQLFMNATEETRGSRIIDLPQRPDD